VSRLAADPQPPSPRRRTPCLCRALQPREATPRPRTPAAGTRHATAEVAQGRDPPPRPTRRPYP
jgi:hypothetical protein